MFGQSPRHLGSYDSNSADSEIDEADRSQLVFCFFFFPRPGGERVESRRLRLRCGEAAQPLPKQPPGFAETPWLVPHFSVMLIRFTEHD
jgi:hypothetical protein